ncbi:polyprenyl synthetase family protein [Microbacterium neungamense]|uniref:polyprenyl synthetase family protein n=1 Tax=Microbacterium neungamense TaxID=2810535 RepID=UPI00217D4758|nr:polyprenyl synthetase family protein [Microbacterium neungamense]UWF78692.1 polyprenyl synthetase family protein [Microbacterium neungamense]
MVPSSPVIDAVSAHLAAFVSDVRADGAQYGPDAALFMESAAATLEGGKRLRARFCHSGWAAVARARSAEATEPAALWDLAASLEVFQSAALVHDDLIDNSDTRRGRPATHRALESAHRREGWDGDAESFGRASAVLLGDLLVAWSDDLMEQAISGHPQAAAVRAEYARMRRDVTVGQMLDIAEESAWSAHTDEMHLERALRVASLKSARYSVEQPLLLGAALAEADAGQRDALRAFGHPIGMAFQLRDDVLGVFGDEALTGKPAGDDLREGKRTVLVALTRQRLSGADRAALDAALGNPGLDPAQVERMQDAIRSSGALQRVEAMIADYVAAADAALDDAAREGVALEASALEELRRLAHAATTRTS